jgi:hypothetical protein
MPPGGVSAAAAPIPPDGDVPGEAGGPPEAR